MAHQSTFLYFMDIEKLLYLVIMIYCVSLNDMKELTQEKREKIVFYFSAGVSVVLLLTMLFLIGAQTYVRWFINQNFTLVGGNELEILTISVFALILTITYIYRPSKDIK